MQTRGQYSPFPFFRARWREVLQCIVEEETAVHLSKALGVGVSQNPARSWRQILRKHGPENAWKCLLLLLAGTGHEDSCGVGEDSALLEGH